MKIKLFILSILVAVISCFAILQFDTKGYWIFTEENPGDRSLERQIWKVDSDIYTLNNFSPHVSWYLKHRIDGSTMYTALPERIIPFDNHVSLGLQYEKNFMLHVGITNDILGGAVKIRPYFFPSEDLTMTQKLLSSANAAFEASLGKFDFLADVNYFRLNYDLEDSSEVLTKARDDDMWTELDIAFNIVEDLKISVATILKNDFNSSNEFNYGDHHVEVGGDHTIKLNKRKLYLNWSLSEHYRIYEALYLKGDADGLATMIYFRPVFKIKNRLFLKGIARLDLSERMQKQFYELVFKKAWKNNSSINLGYWNVLGSVFPRQGSRIKAVVYIGKVGLSPDIQLFWRMNGNSDYQYYRTTASFETILNLIKRFEIIAGYTRTRFHEIIKPFTSRGSIYIGIRKW